MTNAKLYAYVVGQPWTVRPDMLGTALEILSRDPSGGEPRPIPETVEARRGKRLDGAFDVQIRDGVGVVSVVGPIFRYADSFTYMCGGATVETIARDVDLVLNDPAVHTVLLNVDSPGGQANGVAELAGMIRAANDRKPVVAYVGGSGCSGAYWLACAASEIVMHASAEVGSIGVVMAYPTPKADGKSIEFVSSVSPDKRPNVATEKGRAVVQAAVDDMADLFVESVARYRGVTVDKVLSDFGRGGYLIGSKALKAGMVDSLGTYEGTLARLAEQGGRRPEPASPKSAFAPGSRPLSIGKPMPNFITRLIKGAVAQTPDDEDIDLDAIAAVASAGSAPRLSAALSAAEPMKVGKVDVTQSDEYKALADRLAKAEAAAKGIDDARADAFAAGLVQASKILPAGAADAKALHLRLASDDRANPLESGSRVETLGRLAQALPAHSLTKERASAESLPAGSRTLPADGAGGGEAAGPERIAYLMGLTSLGEAAARSAH